MSQLPTITDSTHFTMQLCEGTPGMATFNLHVIIWVELGLINENYASLNLLYGFISSLGPVQNKFEAPELLLHK